MPLESCMIIVDNSEFMRNGDYVPTRLEAQQDAANLLVGAKTQSHPESTVGVSAGTELLVSPTEDVGKLLGAVHGLSIGSKSQNFHQHQQPSGGSSVTASLQVASLALKHRKNKNGSQRIVLFVGSPLDGLESRALAKAGRQLKKNNVSIDVVAMGELEVNEAKLRDLVDAANGRNAGDGAERTCHLVTIPPGVLPSDVLASSPVVHGGTGGSAFAAAAAAAAAGVTSPSGHGGGGGSADAFAEFGGVDPNMDPELAMALRVSMEEERARQERLAAQQAREQQEGARPEADADAPAPGGDAEMPDAGAAGSSGASASASASASAEAPSAMDLGLSEEEALLQQALAMSMNENEPPAAAASAPASEGAGGGGEEDDDDEAAAMQLALQMSLAQAGQDETPGGSGSGSTDQARFQDPGFVNQLLGSLPGVNPNDPAIQSALQNMAKDGENENENDKDESETKKGPGGDDGAKKE
ncbi:unnamed protein product [Pseudo-nitzschia multistriata]|uniref:26S proteasome regulatory subunit RPN10 n=1 Tax=Pseudo-nitzschia multistriata TaxID=183589 RepID=A0A448YVI5_9STRA|nr:unnamed protein product [Pseudo-nitzschia multistriata]